MKKILLLFFIIFSSITYVGASEFLALPYKNIKDEAKLKYVDGVWTDNVKRKDNDYFVKIISGNLLSTSEYYTSNGDLAFTTNCQFDFLKDGDFIGYSNQDLKFYSFSYEDGFISRRELNTEEVQQLFPDYEIILVSEFSNGTNSLKVKKRGRNFKIILLNDTFRTFENYSFTTGNSEIEKSPMVGVINIKKRGMLHFSKFGENTKNAPWLILLVR